MSILYVAFFTKMRPRSQQWRNTKMIPQHDAIKRTAKITIV